MDTEAHRCRKEMFLSLAGAVWRLPTYGLLYFGPSAASVATSMNRYSEKLVRAVSFPIIQSDPADATGLTAVHLNPTLQELRHST